MIKLWCFFSALIAFASTQSEGDVRLTGGSSSYFGRLDIFWKGKWSTFCGISRGGAQAACRQLGYLDFIRYMPLDQVNPNWKIPQAGNNIPIAIGSTSCDYSWAKGLLHILRCGYSTDVSFNCNHTNDIVLVCEDISLWRHPYNTQVQFNFTTYPSQGILEIYLNQEWGNICYTNFNQYAGDSACRQMGYTNAKTITGTISSTDIVWLNDVTCKSSSYQCLNHCFKAPHSTTSCSSNKYVSIQCTYDISIANKATSGSKDICTANSEGGSINGEVVVGVIAVVAIVVIIVTIVVITLTTCLFVPSCYLAQYRHRAKGYQSIQN